MSQASDHARLHQPFLTSGRMAPARKILSAGLTLTNESTATQFLDPGGSDRIITLPTHEVGGGRFFSLMNVGSSGLLDVRDSAGTAQCLIEPLSGAWFFSSGAEWGIIGGRMNYEGSAHRGGLVPDPGPSSVGTRILREDGWGDLTGVGVTNAYKFMTDGTNTATGSGEDTFKFRSSSNKITVTVGNNDITHGDNLNLSVNEAAVDHNALLNYSANRHIDHTAVSVTAGVALTGGGTINTTLNIDWDPTEPAAATVALADTFAFYDLSNTGVRKDTFSSLNSILDHNALVNYSANQHVDHSTVSILAGTGLSGGGTIAATRTLSLDIHGLTTDTPATVDELAFYDVSGADTNKMTIATLSALISKSAPGVQLTFSTTTTDADPGTGTIRFNSATPATVTTWYVDNTDVNSNSITAFLDALGANTNTQGRSFVIVMDPNDTTKYQLAKVTAAVVDGTGYRKLTVSPLASGGLPSNGANIVMFGVPSGADGAAGAAATEAFVTIGNTAGLSAERALAVGTGLGLTDGGANSTVTLAINDAELLALAGLTSAADKLPYFTGAGTAALADFVAAARAFVAGTATSANLRTLGTEILGEITNINTQTGSYTLVLGDKGKMVEMNAAGANNLTIPPNSSVALPVNTVIQWTQIGAGQTTIVAGAGVTLRNRNGLKSAGQYAGGYLYQRATDEWVVQGDLVA